LKKEVAAILGIGIVAFSLGCVKEQVKDLVQKPTLNVTDITLESLTLKDATFRTTLVITNPNPFGGQVESLTYKLYYLQDGQPKYLGEGGTTEPVTINADGETTTQQYTTVENLALLKTLKELLEQGSVQVKAIGTVQLKVRPTGFVTFTIDFETVKEIVLT